MPNGGGGPFAAGGGFGVSLSVQDRFSAPLSKFRSQIIKSQAAAQALTAGVRTSAIRMGIGAIAVAGVGYAFSKALKPGLEFEKQMREVSAVTGATAEEFKAMTNVAKKLGIETVFSAKAAASAMYMLGSRGVKTAKDFDTLLVPAMDLAAAMKFDLVPATELMMATLKMFDLEVTQATEVADLLTNAYRNSAANAEKLAVSMNYAGFAFSSVGYTLRETLVPLEALYDLGLEASMAGTSLRKAISSLIKPTSEATKALMRMGLSTADVSPELYSFIEIIETLEESNLSAADALAIFGQRAGPAMFKLVSMGADALREYDANLGDVGSASETAKEQLKGFQGAITLLKSSLEGIFIAFEELLAPALEEVTRGITEQINAFLKWIMTSNNMVKGIQDFMKAYSSMLKDLLKPSLQILKDLVTGMMTLVGTWSKMTDAQKEFVIKGIKAGTLLATLGIAVGVLGPAVLGLAKAFSILGISAHLFNIKFMLILAAFALGVVAGYLLQDAWKKNWKNIRGFFEKAWEKIEPIFEDMKGDIENIRYWLGRLADASGEEWKRMQDDVKNIKYWWGKLADAVSQEGMRIRSDIENIKYWWGRLTEIPFVKWTIKCVVEDYEYIRDVVAPWISKKAVEGWNWIVKCFVEDFEYIRDVVAPWLAEKTSWDWVVKCFVEDFEYIRDVVAPWISKKAIEGWNWTIKCIVEDYEYIRDTVAPWIARKAVEGWDWTIKCFVEDFERIKDAAKWIKDRAIEGWKWIISIDLPKLTDLAKQATKIVGDVYIAIAKAVEAFKTGGISLWDIIVTTWSKGLPAAIEKIKKQAMALSEAFIFPISALGEFAGNLDLAGKEAIASINEISDTVGEKMGVEIPDHLKVMTLALIATESSFARNAEAVSALGDEYKGWGQLGEAMIKDLDKLGIAVEDVNDPTQSLTGTMGAFLIMLKRSGGDVKKAILLYKGWGKELDKAGGDIEKLPKEAKKQLAQFLKIFELYMKKTGQTVDKGMDYVIYGKSPGGLVGSFQDATPQLSGVFQNMLSIIGGFMQNIYAYLKTVPGLGEFLGQFEDLIELWKTTKKESIKLIDAFTLLGRSAEETGKKMVSNFTTYTERIALLWGKLAPFMKDKEAEMLADWNAYLGTMGLEAYETFAELTHELEQLGPEWRELHKERFQDWLDMLNSLTEEHKDYYKRVTGYMGDFKNMTAEELENIRILWEDNVGRYAGIWDGFLSNVKGSTTDLVEDLITGIEGGKQAWEDLWTNFGDAIVQAFRRAVAEVIVEKLGLDKIFEGNILSWGNLFTGLGNLIGGIFKGIGNVIGGIFGGIGGAVGEGALGGTTVVAGQLAEVGVAAEATAAKMGIMTKIGLGLQSVVTGIGGALKYFATMGSSATTVLGALSSGLVGVAGFVGTAIASWTAFSWAAENVIGPALRGIKNFISGLLGIDTRPWFEEIAESAERTGEYLTETSEKLASGFLSPQMLASFSGRLVRFAEVVASGLVTIGEMTHEESVKWLAEAIQTNEHLTEEYKNTLLGILEASKDGAQAVAEAAKEAMVGYHNEILLLDHLNRDLIERGSKASADQIAKQVVATEEAIKKTTGAVKKSFEEQLFSLQHLTDYGTEAYWHFYREAKRSFEATEKAQVDSVHHMVDATEAGTGEMAGITEGATDGMAHSYTNLARWMSDEMIRMKESGQTSAEDIRRFVELSAGQMAQKFGVSVQTMIDNMARIPTRIGFDIVGNLHMPSIPRIGTQYFDIIGRYQSAGAPSYQMGIPYVPQTTLAWLHPKEAVLTAPQATEWRKGESPSRGAAGGVEVRDIYMTAEFPNVDLETVTAEQVERFFDKRALPAIKELVRQGVLTRDLVDIKKVR